MGKKLKCLECGDTIESTHRHEFVRCSCQSCFVDGGTEYFRIGWSDPEKCIEIMEDGSEVLLSDSLKDRQKRIEEREKDLEEKAIDQADTESKPSKEDFIFLLDELAGSIQRMPPDALYSPVTNADHLALIQAISSFLKAL